MVDHPACDKIIVARMLRTHKAKEGVVIQKTVYEIRILENGCSVSGSPSAHDKHPSIHMVRSSSLEVVTFKIKSSNEIPEAGERKSLDQAANSLTRAYRSNTFVFKRSEDVGDEISRPKYMIIREYGY